ncbi:MAG: hypothetical protein PHI63_06635 [Patescibacteria group bacterium]|nr:hypothetical protein [Patescibacteria group bacterium]
MQDSQNLDELLAKLARYECRLGRGNHSETVLEQLRKRVVMLRDEIKLARWRNKRSRITITTGEMKCCED